MTYEISTSKLCSFLFVGLSTLSELPKYRFKKQEPEKREIRIEQKICTEVGCEDKWSLDFDPPISSLGNYVFQFSYPNGSRICDIICPRMTTIFVEMIFISEEGHK